MTNYENSLHVRDLTKSYGNRTLWENISFDLDPGDIMALRGNSGSGKSTLLHTIGLLTAPDSGTITLGQKPLTHHRWRANKQRADTIGFVFQDYALVPEATVTENLNIAARPRLLSPTPDYGPVLERFGLYGREKSPAHSLSGGEQQRLALARLTVRPTPIVLADEPTASLDETNTSIVLDTLSHFANSGRIVILATHHDTTARIATKTLRLGTSSGHQQIPQTATTCA